MKVSTKQERNRVRTVEDLMRRYDLDAIVFLKQASKNSEEGLNRVNAELEGFVNATLTSLKDMQNQIDGSITTHFYKGVPSMENIPASEWTTDELKKAHLGDLYYDQDTGYAYRFALNGEVYEWTKIVDNDVVEALALANAAQDTADGKRRVFTDTPSPPYDKGDLWIKDREIYICLYSREDGEFASGDFGVATKYTDDTRANEVAADLAKNYSTTVAMETAIETSKAGILAAVSATYTTKDALTEEITAVEKQISSVSVKADGISTKVSEQESSITGLTTRVSATESSYVNLSNKFEWIVKSGSNESDFTITERMASLTAQYINLNGWVTFSGLDSTAQSKITSAERNASSALSQANAAFNVASANDAALTAWCHENDKTLIDGGKIHTDSLFARDITATGTISGVTLNGANINLMSDDDMQAKLTATSRTGAYMQYMPGGFKMYTSSGELRAYLMATGLCVQSSSNQDDNYDQRTFVSSLGVSANALTAYDYAVIGDRGHEAGYALRVAGKTKIGGEIISTSMDAFRMVAGNYGAYWRFDGTNLYLLFTNSGDQYGTYNSLRPLTVNVNGGVTLGTAVALANNITLSAKNASGSWCTMAYMGTNNYMYFGTGASERMYIGDESKTKRIGIRSAGRIDFCPGGQDTNGYSVSLLLDGQVSVFRPTTNKATYLGNGEYRFYTAYLAAAVNVSSDKRLKDNIKDLDERYFRLADLLSTKSYSIIDDRDTRTHIGFVAQDVEAIMAYVGLSEDECAFFNRNWVNRKDYTGYELSLVYEELHTIQIASLQKQIIELK